MEIMQHTDDEVNFMSKTKQQVEHDEKFAQETNGRKMSCVAALTRKSYADWAGNKPSVIYGGHVRKSPERFSRLFSPQNDD